MNATIDKAAQTRVPVLDVIAERWSPRAFQTRPVEAEKLLALLEAARWAASSRNLQPWHFIIATQQDTGGYARMLDCLNERNRQWAQHAPVLLLVVAEVVNSGMTNRTALYDTGLAVGNLTLQATADGLALRQMGGFDRDLARRVYQIPDTHEPICVLALGYRGDPDLLPDDLRERELAPRDRKPLSDFVYNGSWGSSAPLTTDTVKTR
jgi:nitroreductase